MPNISIFFGDGGGDDLSPYHGAEGFKDASNQYIGEMLTSRNWAQRFEGEIDDHPARNERGYIRQAGTSGVIPGFQ